MSKLKEKWRNLWRFNPENDVQNKELFRFGLGVGGQCHSYNLVTGYFEYFCNWVLLINPLYTGILLWGVRGWDAINDPLAGAIIDKVELKSGEKLRPYVRAFALPVGLFAALMFVNFGFSSLGAKMCYVGAMYFLWDTCYSFHDIAQWSMVSRMTNQPKRREAAAYAGRLGCFAGSLLPGLISFVAGLILSGHINMTMTQLFIICGIYFGFFGMVVSLSTLGCKERAPLKPPEGNLLAGFKLIKGNKIVIWLTLATVVSSCTLVMQATYFFQFMVQFEIFGYKLNGLTALTIFGALTGIPGSIAMFLTPIIAKKVGGMQRILLIACITNIVCRILAGIIGYEGFRFIFLILFTMIFGIPMGMMNIATTALWGDSVDYTEWKTGQRNEGAIFAFSTFMSKMGSSLNFLFSGITLWLLKFDPEAIQLAIDADESAGIVRDSMQYYVSPEFIKWSWWIYILGPAIGSILYLIPLSKLHYGNEERARVERELKELREREAIAATESV